MTAIDFSELLPEDINETCDHLTEEFSELCDQITELNKKRIEIVSSLIDIKKEIKCRNNDDIVPGSNNVKG